MSFWDNPDVELLYEINGLAKDAPSWADRIMEYVGEYGIAVGLALLGLWAWWGMTRRRETRDEAVTGFAGLVWAPLAAVLALVVNIPIRGFVERRRPFLDHKGLDVLVDGKTDFSFVSDHATLTMAIAVSLFMVHRKFGLVAIALAVTEGFCRVYMGVHYPTDVIGGLALGTAVSLLLAPGAMWALTPVVRAMTRVPRLDSLLWAGPWHGDTPAPGRSGEPGQSGLAGSPDGRPGRAGVRRGRDRDLAA
ncbi:phosphatase PAP2 family protein [Streptomyces iconiensis]|uniref:Phosphatase PAP2 family protein n=1 Tax=Streptomyces iconiensis TaxID=1384038 RepID=A0ABT7AAJ2_9ACTN|nr:phosphatase PAP2 family protein [Streptomyces iconiensis]MDJ1138361.1 phosphatase PAP2 family protein [Streptomyces iconiensis]